MLILVIVSVILYFVGGISVLTVILALNEEIDADDAPSTLIILLWPLVLVMLLGLYMCAKIARKG